MLLFLLRILHRNIAIKTTAVLQQLYIDLLID